MCMYIPYLVCILPHSVCRICSTCKQTCETSSELRCPSPPPHVRDNQPLNGVRTNIITATEKKKTTMVDLATAFHNIDNILAYKKLVRTSYLAPTTTTLIIDNACKNVVQEYFIPTCTIQQLAVLESCIPGIDGGGIGMFVMSSYLARRPSPFLGSISMVFVNPGPEKA